MSFDVEQTLYGKVPDTGTGKHVFVSGLARAGTTAIMRALYETGEFRSLTYRDMPFVLMPRMWARMSERFNQRQALHERAHADGILVNFDSPEAFEEVFWRIFFGPSYLHEDRLVPHDVQAGEIERFRRYIAAITCGLRPYLSKNNNNILRLAGISRAFPDAVIVVPFRDPVQQAYSLRTQHFRFLQLQVRDKFASRYMEWLGHHEFGQTHRPFIFRGDEREKLSRLSPDGLDYWLSIWIFAYRHLLQSAPEQSVFVSNEIFRADPAGILSVICNRAGLGWDAAASCQPAVTLLSSINESVSQRLMFQAADIHEELLNRSLAWR